LISTGLVQRNCQKNRLPSIQKTLNQLRGLYYKTFYGCN
jgi:hypothetical protein